jgi:hypothetical protein
VSVLIRRITLAALMAALVGGTLALPASSKTGPIAHASKCKKKKHRSAQSAKKKKKCKGAGQSGGALPGQATHPNVTPPSQNPAVGVSALSVASSPVLGGNGTSGQVTIDGAAPSGGQPVALQSSDPSRATVPANVVVAAGQTTVGFPVGTTAGSTLTTTLTAAVGSSNATAQLKVVSAPSVESVSLERECFTPGSLTANRVTLDVPAPADTPVQLSSDDASALSVAPGFTTVPAGSKTAFFGITAGASNPLVTVTATLGSSFATDTASVNGSSTVPTLTGVTVQPSTIPVGTQSTGTVTLDCEPGPGGALVDLSSSQAGVAAPSQSTVLVPAGQLSAPFTVNTSSVGNANIIATFGATTLQAPVTVIPIDT